MTKYFLDVANQGFPNAGNLCYLNSVLSALMCTNVFRQWCDLCPEGEELPMLHRILFATLSGQTRDARELGDILESIFDTNGRGDDAMQATREIFELLEKEQADVCSTELPSISDFATTLRYHTLTGAQFDCQAVSCI